MIIPFALRLAARRALTGATLADARIEDSAITALDALAKKQPEPFIVVSTDEQNVDLTGQDVTAGVRQVDLVFDIAVASRTTAEDNTIIVAIPHTDAGLELSVNLITRQLMRALFEPNSGGSWGKMFRRIISKVRRIQTRRGAGTEGVRFAAAQIILSVDTIAEPAFGQQPEHVWAEFMTAVRADATIAPQADMIEAMIVGAELPDWRKSISLLGIDDTVANAIGIFPLGVVTADHEPSVVLEVTTEPGGWVINEGAVEENLPPPPDE